jgi:four helix bundle protein
MAKCVTELDVYKKAYRQAMELFDASRGFPPEERFALTSQIRRSSRSICQNLREAWAKRRYAAHFVSKLTDCDGENAETATSLQFALDCHYVCVETFASLAQLNRDVGNMLGAMLADPSPFLPTGQDPAREDGVSYEPTDS